ncbi:MAG: hypothetical protein GY723_13150 [bacterium]|nr:hypothetical protein [bacterium]MCP5066081.1 hypothetical protein [bacterium]
MSSATPAFEDRLAIDEALRRFFGDDLVQGSDGGYSASWAKLKLGPLTLAFPNSKARVHALRLHDLHHIATGYDTSFVGEAEIGAWEIAGGCAGHGPAWVLNLLAMALGAFLAPLATLRAFALGRRTRNLYRTSYPDALAHGTVGKLRDSLELRQAEAHPTSTDALLFGLWSIVGMVLMALTVGLLLSPIAVLVWWIF